VLRWSGFWVLTEVFFLTHCCHRNNKTDDCLPACQRHQPPTATSSRTPTSATAYSILLYTSGRLGFFCGRTTATVEEQNCDNAGTILSGAIDAFVLLMAEEPCDFLFFFGAVYKCTYSLAACKYIYIRRQKSYSRTTHDAGLFL